MTILSRIRARALVGFLAVVAALAPIASPALPPAPPRQPAAGVNDEAVARFFDDYAARTMKRLEIPGGAMVVVRNGRVLLARGYGQADVASRRPVDVDRSLFRAASISKTLPWLLVMQLVEEGRLDLDRDVNFYLDFRIPEAFGRPITMRHLMTHSAGFPERFHGVFDPDLSQPLGRRLRDNIPKRVYAPGTTIAYSNYGAALAGYIVQRLRGEPWERLVSERIFAPLGMRHSTVAQPVPAAFRADLVSTYVHGSAEPGKFRVTPLAPMGSLTASPADMGRLLAMLTRGGAGEKGRIVAPRTLASMFALQKPLGPGLPDGFGLGFLVGRYRGVHYAGHAGNMSTVATDLELLPDQGLGYYYVFNSQGPNEEARRIREDLLHAAIDRFGGGAPLPIDGKGASSAADVAGAYISSRRIFSGPLAFSGLMNTTEAVANRDGSLTIESAGALTHWLPAGRDRFVEERTGIPLAVTRGGDGQVARIASASLYPAAIFERAPAIVGWVPGVAGFSFAVFFLALFAKPIAWAVARRRRKARERTGAAALAAPRRPSLTRWSRRAYWTIAATLAGWAAFGLCLAIDFETLFTVPAIVPIGLALLSLLSLPFALLIVADACSSWRDPERGWMSRIGNSLLAAACCGIAWLFYMLDVVNPSLAW